MNLIILNANSKTPLYLQLYKHFKAAIESNRLKEGEKMPSIRGLAKDLSISKITVEKAYQQLMSEGYIENYDRSRYTVKKFEGIVLKTPTPSIRSQDNQLDIEHNKICYDFASGDMDKEGFNFALWKGYINKAFLQKERLFGYGDIKGEDELRREIAKYIQKSRGVQAHKEQIIIGAGVQSLLSVLCSILQLEHSSIAFEEPGFKNGRRIFADHSFQIVPIPMQKDGIDMEQLVSSGEKLVYVSPSHQFPTGYIMPIAKRSQLLNWAEEKKGIIIEDDYDSEFRYFGRPIPALKGLDQRGKVVYLGSLSKIVPPSIRISYMVLPEEFLEIYQKKASLYNQTASTIEQLALAHYMADGHLERQIRRLRKLYHEKRRLFLAEIKAILGDKVEVNENESGLHILLSLKSELPAEKLAQQALEKGCRVAPVQDYYLERSPEKLPQVILYFSKIPAEEMKNGIDLLRDAWFSVQ